MATYLVFSRTTYGDGKEQKVYTVHLDFDAEQFQKFKEALKPLGYEFRFPER